MWEAANFSMGVNALLSMILSIALITASWWALQSVKFDLYVKNINGPQAKLLQILLSIAIGHGAATFFIDYMQWTLFLKYLF